MSLHRTAEPTPVVGTVLSALVSMGLGFRV